MPERLIAEANRVAGPDTSRAARDEDAIDGVAPRLVVEPPTADALAATLAWLSHEHLSAVPRGRSTKLGWGAPPSGLDVVVSTSRLDAVVAHRHGDLTATVEAGASLEAVNRQLARHGQWLPLDPPFDDRASIGGVVATNDSGPRRHRFGAPRDLIIGMELARSDGTLAKSGGIVVKNVAGYDLARLLTGSFGSLAVIVRATFKLFPLTEASRTLVADVGGAGDAQSVVSALTRSQLTPTALEIEWPPPRLLVRFESVASTCDRQVQEALRLAEAAGAKGTIVEGGEETALWEAHAKRLWDGPGAVVKIGLMPGELAETVTRLDSSSPGTTGIGRAGLGVLLVRLARDVESQARTITGLRERFLDPRSGGGSAVIVRGSRELKTRADVWGSIGDGLELMRAVKRQFDPAMTLSPGRVPWA